MFIVGMMFLPFCVSNANGGPPVDASPMLMLEFDLSGNEESNEGDRTVVVGMVIVPHMPLLSLPLPRVRINPSLVTAVAVAHRFHVSAISFGFSI